MIGLKRGILKKNLTLLKITQICITNQLCVFFKKIHLPTRIRVPAPLNPLALVKKLKLIMSPFFTRNTSK